MNQHNMDRLGGPMHEAYPYHRFMLSPHLPDNIIAIQTPREVRSLRLIMLTEEDS